MSNYSKCGNVIKIESRCIFLKLKSIKVEKLYGYFDYFVPFNEDVTFLYGSNGCGKTTILNLTTIIITGHLFKLFDYQFKSLELNYVQNYIENTIIVLKNDESVLKVNFNGTDHPLERLDYNKDYIVTKEGRMRQGGNESFYYKYYPWLKEIRTLFDYVFLPLSRSNNILTDFYDDHYDDERYQVQQSAPLRKRSPLEHSLNLVKRMIVENYLQITTQINHINEEFRNKMFVTLFHFNEKDNLIDIQKVNQRFYENKDKLVKTFNDIGILTKDLKEEIDTFYNKLKAAMDDYNNARKSKDEFHSNIGIIISNFSRIQQIYELSELADEANAKKELALLPIKLFLSLINSFFKDGECKKEVIIDSKGKVCFIVNDCSESIDIEKLSSGEQQILIFFAYLVYGLREKGQGIFIVDEPELSLHLAWQKKFVKSILEINSNVQLIFATHSPEIIICFIQGRIKKQKKEVMKIIKYDFWYTEITSQLYELFVLFLIAQYKNTGIENTGESPFSFIKDTSWEIDNNKVKAYYYKLSTKIADLDQEIDEMRKKVKCKVGQNHSSLISGKFYFASLKRYLLNFSEGIIVDLDLRNMLIRNFDINTMDFLRRIVLEIKEKRSLAS